MMLRELLQEQSGIPDVMIKGLADDSRMVEPGDVFCALGGDQSDGRVYIDDAIGNGAVAVLAESPVGRASVPVVEVKNLRHQLGSLASRVYGDPSQQLAVVAVTGTNGKTSFTHLMAQAFTLLDQKGGMIGTLGFGSPDALCEPGLTTPPAATMHRRMRQLADNKCRVVALEASSHGLVQGRLDGIQIDTAVLTNITHDHLDYHGSFENYKAAKRRLFEFDSIRNAIVNLDDEFGRELAESYAEKLNVVGYSRTDARALVCCTRSEFTENGLILSLVIDGKKMVVRPGLFGGFNVDNLLAVTATLVAMGVSTQNIVSVLESLTPVPGRMDIVATPGKPAVVVDYAHTPDALEKSLTAVRQHFSGNVSCVFGCGGDRDTLKRPVMGEIAGRLADIVVLTSDNPRSEDPGEIIAQIESGLSGSDARSLVNRAEAIGWAIDHADETDVVLVAGKGHETYQELASGRVEFSDYQVIGACMESWEAEDGRGE